MRDTLLIIEDEELLGEELERHMRDARWRVERVRSLADARSFVSAGHEPLVVLSDMSLPDGNALDLLEESRRVDPAPTSEWVLLTGYGTVPDSVRALRLGAFDFLEKPCPLERVELVVSGAARSARAQRRLRNETARGNERYSPEAFLGSSREAAAVRGLLRRLAGIPLSTLLIEGETGTGKGLVARILHYGGRRSSGPLVEVNCAAFARELMESELFGHEMGAFTGARGRHRGLFEQAHGGTLFLDEIGSLEPALQAKLLKVVEDGRVRRVGGERETEVDVQIFAASNRNLAEATRRGTFREDLLHRLRVITLELPPLRERMEDLEQLVPVFMAEFSARSGKRVTSVPPAVWERLRSYAWPGNVRELRNVIERSVLLADSDTLDDRWLHLPTGLDPTPSDASERGEAGLWMPLDGTVTLDQLERRAIEEALRRHRHNVSAAARTLGVSRQTLRYRIEKHGLGRASSDGGEAGRGRGAEDA